MQQVNVFIFQCFPWPFTLGGYTGPERNYICANENSRMLSGHSFLKLYKCPFMDYMYFTF